MHTHPITSLLAGSSTVYVTPSGYEVVGMALKARPVSSGVISGGQLLPSQPGVAWMCSIDGVHAS